MKSQGRPNIVLKNQCTIALIIKTQHKERRMKTEFFNNIANEAIYKLQYDKNLYLAHETIKKNIDTFFHNNRSFDCNSRSLLFKILINPLIELFLKTTYFSKQISIMSSPQTLCNITFLLSLSPI